MEEREEANYARILQNMIEEAEENLLYLEKVHEGREHLEPRFAELREAMALVAMLDPEHYKAPA